MNQSLVYSANHPDEIRALLPPALQNIRLAFWSPLIDRDQLVKIALQAKKYGVIQTLPNFTQLVPSYIVNGATLQATVGKTISLKLQGKRVTTLKANQYTIVATDNSKTQNFHLTGPGVNLKTRVGKTGRTTWTLTLRKGSYTFKSDASAALSGSFRVG